jgi:hypothetical protein
MWPFKPKPAPPGLDERLETLERAVRSLRLDWEDTYEKIARLMSRIAKRQALAARAETAEDAPESPNAEGPALDDFSQRVLAQRSHRRLG